MTVSRDSIRDGLFLELGKEGQRLGLFEICTMEERRESRRRMLAELAPGEDAWVFGYGSLMWNPAIRFAERRPARLHGWHRAFCLWAPIGRGTPENPGLVLGLDRGGSCHGIAYRIAAADIETELDLLWQRELVSNDSYRPRWVPLKTGEGPIRAIGWTINRGGNRYAGRLPLEKVARHMASAGGSLGTSREYLESTVAGLDALGIGESALHEILELVRGHRPAGG